MLSIAILYNISYKILKRLAFYTVRQRILWPAVNDILNNSYNTLILRLKDGDNVDRQKHNTRIEPFKAEAQTALFKDPVRTALWTLFFWVVKTNQFML